MVATSVVCLGRRRRHPRGGPRDDDAGVQGREPAHRATSPSCCTVDWFLDRCRTVVNVLGDMNVSLPARRQDAGASGVIRGLSPPAVARCVSRERFASFSAMDTEERVLRDFSTLAVVGASRHPEKAAFSVPSALQAEGFRVIPVNPEADTLFGERAYPTLTAMPEPVEVVLVFRPSDEALLGLRRRRCASAPRRSGFSSA